MRNLFNTLSFRLFITLLIMMAVLFGVYTFITIKSQEDHMMTSIKLSAHRISDFIKGSTRYGMMLNRREDTHQIIKRLGVEPGIEVIRIFNKKGEIMFSSVEEEIGSSVDMKSEACYICHTAGEPLESIPDVNRTRVIKRIDGHRSLGLINPIKNENDCSNADCHAHPSSIKVLGVLDVKMSLDQIDHNIEEAQQEVIVFSLIFIVLVNIVSALFIRTLVHSPVHKLISGAKEIADGNLDSNIVIKSKTEIGALAESFNEMTGKLSLAYTEIKDWSLSLEKKVEEKTQELKKAHTHLVTVEKMASLGQLSATVAHELNNPLEGILTLTKLQVKRLNKDNINKEILIEVLHDLSFIADEAIRCGNIVKNLILFSKQQPAEFKEASIEQVIERSILLIVHHLDIRGIKLVRDYKISNPIIICNAHHLQQAFVALLINAVEAMTQGGMITIATKEKNDNFVQIDVTDTGQGIQEEMLGKVFEPFFTTKTDGKGVGLGLAVVYGIISSHHGDIKVRSVAGEGTTFEIIIPRDKKILVKENEGESNG